MIIQGLQKLTLLDYPGHMACTVFLAGCNMRCPFCHNASIVVRCGENEEITQEEFFAFLGKRRGILDGVCITGGEPLLNGDIDEFIVKIKNLGFEIKLDTNGSFPDRLESLINRGFLDYVAMDIKNSPSKYHETTGKPDFDVSTVKRSVEILKRGKVPFEFRTTVVAQLHSKEDIEDIGRWLGNVPAYNLQNFVDSGDLIGKGMTGYPEKTMKELLEAVKAFVPNAALRGI